MSATKSVVNGMVHCDVKLDGKTVLITGANSGIGYETTLEMIKRGARVIMACRDMKKSENAKAELLEKVKDAQLIIKKLNLSSLKSVREFAKDVNETEERLDILINNAGIMLSPPWKTDDGFEIQFGVNHIGHFLLTNLLLDLLKKSAPSRIVIVSSSAHGFNGILWNNIMQENNYNSLKAYGQSKTANILHCIELSKRLKGTGVTCYSLHPGVIKTNLQQHLGDLDHLPFLSRMFVKTWNPMIRYFGATPVKGAQTSIYCAIAPELADVSGKYYANCSEATPSAHARREKDAERLWTVTEEFIEEAEKRSDDNKEHGDALPTNQKQGEEAKKENEELAEQGKGEKVEEAVKNAEMKSREDPDPEQNTEPEKNPEPEQNAEPEKNPEPKQDAEPEKTPEPEQNAEPEKNPEPEQNAEPERNPEPKQDAEPEKTPEPEQNAEPEKNPEPEQNAEPERIPEPEQDAEPEKNSDPEKNAEPEKFNQEQGVDKPAGDAN